ncbi:MAG TPA: two-component regulator propeller domain-containing protein, partial [Chryseolinea sp.]|nr:two-component regulator propeller domain-containing protein [Chryseolinea sp.]
MTFRSIWVALTSVLFVLPVLTFAQGISLNLVHDAQGIITTTAQGMTQDRQGFLWLGTGQGLFRYDGRTFVAYKHDAEVNSLSLDHIENIAADSAGFIWIAPFYHGLDRLDPITGVFTHYSHEKNNPNSLGCDTVNALLTDHSGT